MLKLNVRNLRSIRDQEVELAPITIVYGPNGAGKSSLLYALPILRNIALSPNQNLAAFFNLQFANLGGFEQLVFDHDTRKKIEIELTDTSEKASVSYGITLAEKSGGAFKLSYSGEGLQPIALSVEVTFPYPANQQVTQILKNGETEFSVVWNGVVAQVQIPSTDVVGKAQADAILGSLNWPTELLRGTVMVPLKRGFSQPLFNSVAVGQVITEAEVASLLSIDKYLESRISVRLENIFDRDFRVHFSPGAGVFSLDSTDKRTGVSTELVNDGFGVNQTVYLLSRCMQKESKLICIEEPEIHLHPTAVIRLAKALISIARDEDKRFLISTHSESFLVSLLGAIAKGEMKVSELACYYAKRDKKETIFERQQITDRGQIAGGLVAFMEAELPDVKSVLQVKD